MVVVQRNEITRTRLLSFLTLVLAVAVIIRAVIGFSERSDVMQLLSVLLIIAAFAAMILAVLQIYAHPKRSHVLLFQQDENIVIATNALHEGFKLRFLRDVLGENVFSFTDEERARWQSLEADGYYATLYVRNVRKLIMLRLCTMIFDDVFFVDRNNRWEHHDSSSTSEPSFSKREMPQLKSWGKSGSDHSFPHF
ncbi:MAG: hypothetical protein HY646_08950 [Acidobacteria bacterium]|nr:hypothetical protein [Acidobacteriota bacterium]